MRSATLGMVLLLVMQIGVTRTRVGRPAHGLKGLRAEPAGMLTAMGTRRQQDGPKAV